MCYSLSYPTIHIQPAQVEYIVIIIFSIKIHNSQLRSSYRCQNRLVFFVQKKTKQKKKQKKQNQKKNIQRTGGKVMNTEALDTFPRLQMELFGVIC